MTVGGVVDGVVRKIHTSLEADDYKQAIQAHDQNLTIRCVGELVKEGRSFILRHPRNVRFEQES